MAEPNEPAAPAPVPVGESVANNPTPTDNPVPASAPDMHGFTSEDLAGMRTFIDNNGGWDKIKSRISNPQPVEKPVQNQPQTQPQSAQNAEPAQSQPQPQPSPYKAPEGSISASEFIAQQYYAGLAKEEKYAPIAKEIASGALLEEMGRFGIKALNQDGSINDAQVRLYLDLKAQTVPAQSTSSEPNASPAPTVEYVAVENGQITSMEQAYSIVDQDMRLKAQGLAGHPDISAAEEYIKTGGKPAKKS